MFLLLMLSAAFAVGLNLGINQPFLEEAQVTVTPPGAMPPASPKDFGKIDAEFARILTDPLATSRLGKLLNFADGANETDLQHLLVPLRIVPTGDARDEARRVLISRWSELAPAAVLAWGQNLPNSQLRSEAIPLLFGVWATRDAAGALASAGRLRDFTLRDSALTSVLAEIAHRNPALALATLAQEPPNEARNHRFAAVFAAWAKSDQPAAATAALALPAGPTKDQAIAGVRGAKNLVGPDKTVELPAPFTSNYARLIRTGLLSVDEFHDLLESDLTAAAAYLDQHPLGDKPTDWERERRGDDVRQLAMAWTEQDPAAAIAWAERFDSPSKGWALSSAMPSWSEIDPIAAGTYLKNHGEAPGLDYANREIFPRLARVDAQISLDLANSIPQGHAFNEAVTDAIKELARQNPAAAWTYVQKLPPGELRSNLIPEVLGAWSHYEPAVAGDLLLHLSERKDQLHVLGQAAGNWFVPELGRFYNYFEDSGKSYNSRNPSVESGSSYVDTPGSAFRAVTIQAKDPSDDSSLDRAVGNGPLINIDPYQFSAGQYPKGFEQTLKQYVRFPSLPDFIAKPGSP